MDKKKESQREEGKEKEEPRNPPILNKGSENVTFRIHDGQILKKIHMCDQEYEYVEIVRCPVLREIVLVDCSVKEIIGLEDCPELDTLIVMRCPEFSMNSEFLKTLTDKGVNLLTL